MAGNILRVKNQQGQWVDIPAIIGPQGAPGTTVYTELEDKPSINGTTLVGNKTSAQIGVVDASAVVQQKGQSESDIMSQKAVTDELNLRPVATDTEITTTPGIDIYTKGQVDAKFFEKTSVVQSEGEGTAVVMSQKAVTDELAAKEDVANKKNVINDSTTEYPSSKAVIDYVNGAALTGGDIVQSTGSAQDKVMSQNAVTSQLGTKENVSNKKNSIANSTSDYPSSKAVVDYVGSTAVPKTAVVQETGTSTTDIMSQDAVTDALGSKEDASNKKTSIEDSDTDFPTSSAVVDYAVPKTAIVQETGTSTTDIMSQDAVTDALDLKENTSNKKDSISNSTSDYPSSKAVVDYAVAKTDIVQTVGTSETSVMSQDAVTDALGLKEDASNKKTSIEDNDTDFPTSGAVVDYAVAKTDIVQSTGTSETSVMSQDAVTDALELKEDVSNKKDSISNSTSYYPSSKAVVDYAVAKTDIVQTVGTSETSVMSQDAVTDELNLRPVAVSPSSAAVVPGLSSYSSLSGTWASRPTNMYIGYQYFCTDKKTTEGNRNGILIIYAGNSTWVDALGRVIS